MVNKTFNGGESVRPKHRRKLLIVIITLILLVALAAAAWWFLTQKQGTTDTTQSTNETSDEDKLREAVPEQYRTPVPPQASGSSLPAESK